MRLLLAALALSFLIGAAWEPGDTLPGFYWCPDFEIPVFFGEGEIMPAECEKI